MFTGRIVVTEIVHCSAQCGKEVVESVVRWQQVLFVTEVPLSESDGSAALAVAQRNENRFVRRQSELVLICESDGIVMATNNGSMKLFILVVPR